MSLRRSQPRKGRDKWGLTPLLHAAGRFMARRALSLPVSHLLCQLSWEITKLQLYGWEGLV